MTDEKLIALLDSDPSEGIRLMIDRYSSLVYKIAYGKLRTVYSSDDIEEFVSFIFSTIYERRGRIDLSRGTLKGYISTISKRMSIDEYRRQLSRVATEPLTDDIAQRTSGEQNVAAEAERAFDEKVLAAAMNRLDKKDRELLLRRYYYKQTSVQIAGELHISEDAARKRISRALEKLRKILSENGFSYYS